MEKSTDNSVFASNRIEIVDALRGFALFGILLINITTFYAPGGPPGFAMSGTLTDRVIVYATIMLVESKFFTLFSFLFGLGFAFQLSRADEREFKKKFARRLCALAVFGVAHIVFVWEGDILLLYALVGFLLVPFRHSAPKTLLKWAGGLLLAAFLLTTIGLAALSAARLLPETREKLQTADSELFTEFAASRAIAVKKLSESGYFELLPERVADYKTSFFLLATRIPTVLAMFLLGLWAGKKEIPQKIGDHLELLKKVRRWGLLAGLSASLTIIIFYATLPPVSALAVLFYDQTLAGPLLSMGYAAWFVLAARNSARKKAFALLGAVGRMSLTNYLAQSAICAVLFSGYGFALAGKTNPFEAVLISLAIFAAQILMSVLWLKFFRFGPAEWLWRSITYWRKRPLLIH